MTCRGLAYYDAASYSDSDTDNDADTSNAPELFNDRDNFDIDLAFLLF